MPVRTSPRKPAFYQPRARLPPARTTFGFGFGRLELNKGSGGSMRQEPAFFGGCHATGFAQEQLRTQILLQLAYRPRNGRLGQGEQLGGLRGASCATHSQQRSQAPQVLRQRSRGGVVSIFVSRQNKP